MLACFPDCDQVGEDVPDSQSGQVLEDSRREQGEGDGALRFETSEIR